MCDIGKAKLFSVIFCQLQTTVSIVECHIFQVCTFYLFPHIEMPSSLILRYFTLTAARTLLILTILAHLFLLLIISRSE